MRARLEPDFVGEREEENILVASAHFKKDYMGEGYATICPDLHVLVSDEKKKKKEI